MFHFQCPRPDWHAGALSWQHDKQRDKIQKGRDTTERAKDREKVPVVSEEEEKKLGLEAVPVSGRGGNIMIEKWYQPLLPVGGVHANTLCSNEWIFQRIYLLVVELSPACHSVCHRETKIYFERHCRQSPLQCQNKFTQTWLTVISLTQHLLLFFSFFPRLYCVILDAPPLSVFQSTFSLLPLLSPSPLLSPDIKPWLLCKCIQLSNITHCSKLQDSTCFSSLHHFVAVGPFPLYVRAPSLDGNITILLV